MVPIAFTIVSAAACAFLLYVLAQFRRESLHPERVSARPAILTQADITRIEAASRPARESSRAPEGERTRNEAVMRKEVLTSAFLGLVALLSPFILVLLLHRPTLR
jgi:hypothetical protein